MCTTHQHAPADDENEEARALLDHVDKSDTLDSGDTQPASASVDSTQSSLAHNRLGAHAEDDATLQRRQ